MGGTHYNEKMRQWHDPVGLLATVAAGQDACARGEHDEFTVPKGRVSYGPFGVRRSPGERYCLRCSVRIRGAG